MTQNRITIHDVAAKAGVSHQTVSRVINGSNNVREKTRLKVEEAIAALEYRPNAMARSMALGRTSLLACLAPNLTDYTFARIIESAQMEARQRGYFLLSATAPDEATFNELLDELVTNRRTEGLLVIDPYVAELSRHAPAGYPTVFVGSGVQNNENVDTVALQDEEVGYEATRHLLALGHQHLGMVTGPLNEACARKRANGFERALQEAGLTPRPEWILEGDWSPESGYTAFNQLAQQTEQPTAIFAQNDQMAVGVIHSAQEKQISVPAQLSIIGVDDIPLAEHLTPPLTTLQQDFQHIGREAIKLLIQAVEQPQAPRQHLRLSTVLIQRHSTQPYPLP